MVDRKTLDAIGIADALRNHDGNPSSHTWVCTLKAPTGEPREWPTADTVANALGYAQRISAEWAYPVVDDTRRRRLRIEMAQ